MKKLLILFVLVILSGGGVLFILNSVLPASEIAIKADTDLKSDELPANHIFDENLEKMDPLEFLHSLEKRTGIVTLMGFTPEGWIKQEHINELIKLVDSKEPCAAVVSALSSYLPPEGSTVGNEAMFLIDGYKSGQYPPALYSAGGTGSRDPEEYKKWWKETQTCEIVYLAPDENPQLPAEETKQEAKIYTVHTQKELEEFTNGLLRRYVIWVDIGAADIVDKEWLYKKTIEEKLPVVLIGCGNTIYAFRDILKLNRDMHGPKIPEDQKKIDGFCVYRFFDEVKTANSITINTLNRSFSGKPVLKDVMNISRKLNNNPELLNYSDGYSPEQKSQYYYWALRSDPNDKNAENALISILPQISWSILYKENIDDLFNILAWFREQSIKKGNDTSLISFMKSCSGIDGAPAEAYFSYMADILESNPQRFVNLLASLKQSDIDEISLNTSYEVEYRKGLHEKLRSMSQEGLVQKENEIVLKLLGD